MEVGQHAVATSPRIIMIGLAIVDYCTIKEERKAPSEKTMSRP